MTSPAPPSTAAPSRPPSSPRRPSAVSADAPSRPKRPLGRRVALPNGRAIVGGLFVTLAAVGTFAAYTSASTGPTQSVVVANTSIRAGQRLQPGDLRLVAVEVPDAVRAQSFTATDDLTGSVALAPLQPDEVINRSAVRRANDASPESAMREFSFAVEREHALDGRLQRGELIDLVATYGGSDAYTTVVARRVRVLDAGATGSGGVGSSGKITITIALATEAEVLEAAHALEVAKVNVIRSTRVSDEEAANEPASPERYEPAGPPGSAKSSRSDSSATASASDAVGSAP